MAQNGKTWESEGRIMNEYEKRVAKVLEMARFKAVGSKW
nr:MAG TPA_asm: hypothetical protein [Caudoviricetes sp.]